jgi:hypothetical protein
LLTEATSARAPSRAGDGQRGAKAGKAQRSDKPAAGGPESDRLAVAVQLLWELQTRPEMIAILELRIGARADASLRTQLAASVRSLDSSIHDALGEVFPDLSGLPAWPTTFTLILELLQAHAISRLLDSDGAGDEGILKTVAEVASASLRKPKH